MSDERTNLIKFNHSEEDEASLNKRLEAVYHADLCNWKESREIQNVEKEILEDVDKMCVNSLDPEGFVKWEDVKAQLQLNRIPLKTTHSGLIDRLGNNVSRICYDTETMLWTINYKDGESPDEVRDNYLFEFVRNV
ncbi:MAG: hypothetical protein GY928_01905 [Colwellia sp.]|nr:hypothetical protein [Colwellia sp.]